MADDTPRSNGASSGSSDDTSARVAADTAADETVNSHTEPEPSHVDTDGTDTASADAAGANGDGADADGADPRRVVVPTHVYKRVTVFSTLFAVVTVVAGFLLLDSATRRATLELSEVDPVLALAGLGCIVLGGVTYAFSTRFQAEGMGNAKEESDETSNNG